jgi:phospholipid/cholesterol/gamma-HCH transport system substrate-binding protein
VERNLLQELKVGCFVVVFVLVVAIATFILGGSSKLLERRYSLNTSWSDVRGLKTGAVVRLAGIDVGEVTHVDFGKTKEDGRVHVQISVYSKYQPRITEDSVAGIATVGVLGDQYITLSVGSPALQVLEDGASIRSEESVDFLSYADRATAIVDNAAKISHKVDLMLGSEEEARKGAVGSGLQSVADLLQGAKEGRGVLYTVLYDERAGRTTKEILDNVNGITEDVQDMTHQIREGDGIAHALIYGEGGEDLAAQLTTLAGNMDGLVQDIKSKDSFAHSLLYDPEKKRMVDDLAQTAASLRSVAQAVESGEGTMGLLIHDPQVYEDMRVLLGGAQRNALLRAYVRATVNRAQAEQGTPWRGPSDDPTTGGR